ncbi:hypothetical protein A2U01_0084442, partial [Trifolium medium]|nr:hypothetical protein [Trifolium medium]
KCILECSLIELSAKGSEQFADLRHRSPMLAR